MAPKSAEGKGKGGGKAAPKKKPSQLNKNRALAALTSDTKLSADDDERTSMSKKISWILRKGAERINIDIDADGWVKLSDLIKAEILDDFPDRTEETLMNNIAESNKQKLRYETKESPNGTMVRALKKKEKDEAKKRDEAGEKTDITIMPEASSGLRGDAPVFVPGQAATPSSPTAMMGAGYGGMYPGFGFPFGYPWPYGFPGMSGAAASPGGAGAQQRFHGRIKSFNQEKGYGFIESAEANRIYGRDVFLHKAHVGDLAVGAMVTFTVGMNKQNMPQARDLAPAEGGGGGKGGKGGKDGKGKGKTKPKAKAKKEKGEKKEGDEAAEPAGEGDEAKPEGESSAPAPEATD